MNQPGSACTSKCTHPYPIVIQGAERDRLRGKFDDALQLAAMRAQRSGVKQIVRRHTGPILKSAWTVQAIR